MKGLMRAVLLFGIFLSNMLFGSNIKLIEPSEAIRLIGNDSVIFVSGENNDTYINGHIVGSVSMPANHLYGPDKAGKSPCTPLYACPKEAQMYIQGKGIKNDQMIIIYDHLQDSHAERVYGFFDKYGHVGLKVLNGGLDSIKALDPNQQVVNKLEAEYEIIQGQIEKAREAGDIGQVEDLETQSKHIEAKINLLESQLLIRSGEEVKRQVSDYRFDPEKFNENYTADKIELKQANDHNLTDAN